MTKLRAAECREFIKAVVEKADAMGVPLHLYPDGSVTNVLKPGAEPTGTIEPHRIWRPATDHGLGDQLKQA